MLRDKVISFFESEGYTVSDYNDTVKTFTKDEIRIHFNSKNTFIYDSRFTSDFNKLIDKYNEKNNHISCNTNSL